MELVKITTKGRNRAAGQGARVTLNQLYFGKKWWSLTIRKELNSYIGCITDSLSDLKQVLFFVPQFPHLYSRKDKTWILKSAQAYEYMF